MAARKKAGRKKTAARKKTVGKRPVRRLSPEGRAAISAAATKRWKAYRRARDTKQKTKLLGKGRKPKKGKR